MLHAQLVSRRGAFALDATLQAPAGSTVVLVGESGSGKTTILRILAGLVRPDAGRTVLGADVWADSASGIWRSAAERDVGWVPQDQALFPHLSAVDNVAFGLRAAGSSARYAVAAAREMLERMGAGSEAQHRPAQLSGGQRQRVALARALVLRPRLLLLDEPLSALDPGARHGIRGTLKAILAEQPATTVYVTHSPLEALAFGERIAVLEAGRVVQEGTAGELLRRPRSSLIADFIGTNFFRGMVARRRDDGLVDIQTSLGSLTTVDPGGREDVFVAVSPREITLSLEAPSGSAQNVFRGRVTELAPEPPLGERVRVAIASEPPLVAEVTAHAIGELGLEPGVQVYAAFKATGVVPYR